MRAEKIKASTITHFSTLGELSGDIIPKPMATLLGKSFNVGEVILVKILKENAMIGDFTLFMPGNVKLKNENYIEIYVRQVGLLISRSRSEAKLIEGEKQLRNVFAAISDPLFLFDQKTGAILDVNSIACSLYGYSREEMLKLKASDMSAEPEITRKSMKDFTTFVPVRHHKKKDGTVFTVEITASLFELSGRSVISASMRDVTERQKAEEELLKTKERLALAQKSAGAGIWDWDMISGQLNWSPEFYSLFGLDPEKDTADFDTWRNLLHPDDRQIAEEEINKSIEKHKPLQNEYRIILASGEIRWINAIGNAAYNKQGKAIRMSGICINITELKKTDKVLKESEEIFRCFMEHSPIYVFFKDENMRSLRLSKNYETMLGKPVPELLNKNMSELFPSELAKNMVAADKRIMREGKAVIVEEELNGRFYSTIKFPIFIDGKPRYLAGYTIDITDRKKSGEEIKNAQLLLKSGIESPRDMIILGIDKDYNYLFFNQAHKDAMLNAYGGKVEMGMNLLECITSETDKTNSMINYNRALNGEPHSTIQEYGDKERSFYETFYNPIINENNEIIGAAAFARDITERKNKEKEILHLSYHDKLTEIYNRRFLEEEMKRLDTKRQLPLSIIMGDLNSLKLTNDTFGHNTGDTILKEAAGLLKRICRSDDILARWGGDEFVILLPKTTETDAEEIAARIKKECSKLIIKNIPLGLSIGIATKTEENQDIDRFILEAESNMYKNKLVEKESSASSIIFALQQALFEKSNETLEHALRIKDNAIKLGRSVKLYSSQIDELSLLASLHDIGKVAIPEAILLKKDKLTEKEWEIIKRHPEIGFNIAQSSPQIIHIAKLILACHENWDGSGYPKGLKKDEIPIVSRIIFICDAYDVMIGERAYKKPMDKKEAIKELKRCAGTQFDPVLVKKFIEILSK